MIKTATIQTIINPHTHWREDGEDELIMEPLIEKAIEGGATVFGPMPNTHEGLITAAKTRKYVEYAESLIPIGETVEIIPIFQLTELTTQEDIDACVAAGIMDAKVYPKGRTTKSHLGVAHYGGIIETVRYAGEKGVRVHFHPEHPWELVPSRDAEYMFMPIVLMFLQETNTTIIWEHGTDARCIPFWKKFAETGRFFVTLTAHHLATNEDEAYGDVQAACKPPPKTFHDQTSMVSLVEEDLEWLMAGADDAPHHKERKHKLGPCACGAYTAPFLLQLYAHGLDSLLQKIGGVYVFRNFTSSNARRLYGLSDNATHAITLIRSPFSIPSMYQIGPWEVEPFWGGRDLLWSIIT